MKKNAFTLIELLAVIVLIGLLAVLIIPKIQSTVKDAGKSTNEASANGLLRAATNYFMEEKTQNNDFEECTYMYTNSTNTCEGFNYTGKNPDSGKLVITSKGEVIMSVQFGRYCYTKSETANEITVTDYEASSCGANSNVFTN